jgi:hypothetical protein
MAAPACARRTGVADGRSGAVAIIQRFGAALNVNVHTHALVLDGVFADDGTGALVFHPARPPDRDTLDVLLAMIARVTAKAIWNAFSDAPVAAGTWARRPAWPCSASDGRQKRKCYPESGTADRYRFGGRFALPTQEGTRDGEEARDSEGNSPDARIRHDDACGADVESGTYHCVGSGDQSTGRQRSAGR